MSRWLIAVVAGAGITGIVSADYVTDRTAAMALVTAGKHEEALAAFEKMAAGAKSDVQKSDAFRQAALCADRLQLYGRAHEFAGRIPIAPLSKTCAMRIMESERRWKDIVAQFKDDDIDSWPDSVKGDAFFGRGYAYLATKDGASAANDLNRAAEYFTDGNAKGLCLIALGDGYANLVKDDRLAIAAYRRAYSEGNIYKHCEAAMKVAEILRRQKKHEAALQELDGINRKEVVVPFWRGRLLCAFGAALADSGKKDDAAARYEEALKIDGLPKEVRSECEKGLRAIR